MSSVRDDAVVVRSHLLGESDRIVTLITKNHGVVRAVAKGVRKTSSRIGARLEPMNCVDLQWAKGKSLDIVQQVELVAPWGSTVSQHYDRYLAGQAMVEVGLALCEHEASTPHYSLLVGGLRALATAAHDHSLILDSYLLRALSLAGWTPSLSVCAQSGETGEHRHFVPSLGGVVASRFAPPGTATISQGARRLLQALLDGDWPAAEASDEVSRREASAAISRYTHYHLERGVRALGQIQRERENQVREATR